MKKVCTVCGSKHKAKGFCISHYQNFKITGSPFGKTGRNRRNSLLSFLDLVESIPIDQNGCKNWPKGISRTGYGVYSIGNFTYSVPRLIHDTLKGSSYKDGLVVRHKCDNRACCNIDHLEIGTQSDNLMDASKRNRLRVGEDNNKSVLTVAQIIKIRDAYPEKSTPELAKEYSVSPYCIQMLIKGKTWSHVSGAKKLIRDRSPIGEKSGRSKLTEKQVLEIRASYPQKNGVQLAKEYGVTHHNIYCILKRKNWTHI